jgi:predicted sulfurtransferase
MSEFKNVTVVLSMKMRIRRYGEGIVHVMLATALFLFSAAAVQAAEAPRITKEEAKAMLGMPKVVFLDTRIGAEWKSSDKKIKGAVRVESGEYELWATGMDKDTTIIAYCT